MKRHFRELSIFAALGALLLALAIAAPGFYQLQPIISLLTREAPSLVVALGVAFIIISRQIDISVGSQFAICSVCAGILATKQWPIALIIPASVLSGALLGSINGLLIAGLKLPSIVVTLATMVTWREGLRWQREGQFVNLPDSFQWFGLSQSAGQLTIMISAFALFLLTALASKRLAAARYVYAVGSNSEAARLAGIRPGIITFLAFVFTGALCGLSAILNIVQSPQVDPKSGTGLELKAIAAVVVGGIAISGGRGNLWGMFAGLLLLACISPALVHLHIEPYWERAIQGAIILVAVMADGFHTRKARD
ncbi:MAG: transporter permease [Verrucomicrobiales bacterium]|nr:transporter permease [Verrucomicrobiales bacterium]